MPISNRLRCPCGLGHHRQDGRNEEGESKTALAPESDGSSGEWTRRRTILYTADADSEDEFGELSVCLLE